ncbi:hypothetical protein ACRARG_13230 [Pseudooceanicola sp. C21-150M6]|uniref:hypothetical protein n=1 Tax=Pseudooceanicola sp. C21-150M6 TaxID=3434355 RepID=UPI003D7F304C
MNIVLASVIELAGWICTVSGPFSLIDTFGPEKSRNKIADFVFGFHLATGRDFDYNTTMLIIGVFFQRDGTRLRLGRIALLVLVVSPLLCVFTNAAVSMVILQEIKSEGIQYPDPMTTILSLKWADFSLLALLVPGTLIAGFTDFCNLYFTKWLYSRKTRTNRAITFFVDILASTSIPITISLAFLLTSTPSVASQIDSGSSILEINLSTAEFIFFTSGSLALSAGLYYSIIRIIIFISGLLLRTLIRISHLNSYAAVHTSAYNMPLTFLSVITAVAFLLCTTVWRVLSKHLVHFN